MRRQKNRLWGNVMRKMRRSIWSVSLVAVLLLSGCGGSDKYAGSSAMDADMSAPEMEFNGMGAVEDAFPAENVEMEEVASSAPGDSAEAGQDVNVSSDYEQKLIKTYDLNFETMEFDKSMGYIDQKMKECGGYMENSNVYGNGLKAANLVLRIPADKVEAFLADTGSFGELMYRSENAEDVTLAYYDAKTRLKTLRTKHERLLTLLKTSETLEDIVYLESELSNCEYEIASFETKIKVYDNQIHYTTINISLDEVNRIQVLEEDSVGQRIQKGLSKNTQELMEGLIDFFVWLVVALPYILLLAVLALVVTGIIRIIRRKRKCTEEAVKEESSKEE